MRKIVVGVTALLIWGVAIGVFINKRAEDKRAEQSRAEARKPAPPPPPPKLGPGKGEFETYFIERSPLSTKPEMLRRLSLREGTPPTTRPGQPPVPGYTAESPDDYDLSKEIFRAFVPENYSPATPHGIIYYLGYKETVGVPGPWMQTLADQHLIFISPRKFATPDWQRAALSLDVIHNLKKQYSIDAKRIYLIAFPDLPGVIGNQMAMGLSDQFNGVISIYRRGYFRAVRLPGESRYWPPQIAPPPADLLEIAKARPHIFVQDPPPSPPDPRWLDAAGALVSTMKQDGFSRVLKIELNDKEEVHYPNFHGPWLETALKFMESPMNAPNDPRPVR